MQDLAIQFMTSPAVNDVLIKPVELENYHSYIAKAAVGLGILPALAEKS